MSIRLEYVTVILMVLATTTFAGTNTVPNTEVSSAPAVAASADQPVPETPVVRSLLTLPEAQVQKLSGMHQEIRLLLLQEREELIQLYAEFEAMDDPLRSLEIQKQIQDLKTSTELSLMQIQVEHARKEGRVEDAERIEQGLNAMLDPARDKTSVAPQRPSDTPRAH